MKYWLVSWLVVVISCIVAVAMIIYLYRDKIPSYNDHMNRNQNNQLPSGNLSPSNGNKNTFVDEAGTVWISRSFLFSLLHNPFKYYVFESHDPTRPSSFEVEAPKDYFDAGFQTFRFASFNFFSSNIHPTSHLFADVLPILLYAPFRLFSYIRTRIN
jgi:hypothetical protein